MEDTQRRLIWHGTFLFLLGLITGFAESSFANVRMGLAAHLEGVMNGIFLVAFGSAWAKVRLFTSGQGNCFLDGAIWHLRELGYYHARFPFRYIKPLASYRYIPRWAALAGERGDGRLPQRWCCDNCRDGSHILGTSARN